MAETLSPEDNGNLFVHRLILFSNLHRRDGNIRSHIGCAKVTGSKGNTPIDLIIEEVDEQENKQLQISQSSDGLSVFKNISNTQFCPAVESKNMQGTIVPNLTEEQFLIIYKEIPSCCAACYCIRIKDLNQISVNDWTLTQFDEEGHGCLRPAKDFIIMKDEIKVCQGIRYCDVIHENGSFKTTPIEMDSSPWKWCCGAVRLKAKADIFDVLNCNDEFGIVIISLLSSFKNPFEEDSIDNYESNKINSEEILEKLLEKESFDLKICPTEYLNCFINLLKKYGHDNLVEKAEEELVQRMANKSNSDSTKSEVI